MLSEKSAVTDTAYQKVHLILFRGRFWIRQGFHELVKRVGGLSPSLTHTVIITGKENNNFAVAA